MADITILGAYGGRGKNKNTSSILLSQNVVLDAGNIIGALGEEAGKIDHIFLSHCHLDHIIDIPFLIDAFFAHRTKPLTIYALPETLASLKKHILNWEIWPDFNDIELLNRRGKSILFKEVVFGEEYAVDGIVLKPVPTNHTVPSCGYVVQKEGRKVLITQDTYLCGRIWEEINQDLDINTLIIEVSFPSTHAKLAELSRHMTPLFLAEELKNIKRESPLQIYINHLKPDFAEAIIAELNALKLPVTVLDDGDVIAL